ncbi:VOC family protein [Microbispora sp. CA-102843]|uniref:VOC family protein n=1 Tax=Microbispora sp. CA-102843 TaxID=3239952 RepID=UPI003D92BA12
MIATKRTARYGPDQTLINSSARTMSIRLGGVVIDANDLDGLAGFWSRLLERGITRREDDWISLGPDLALQRVPEPKTAKNRIHLDLVTDDFAGAVARAAALGDPGRGDARESLAGLAGSRGQRVLRLRVLSGPRE